MSAQSIMVSLNTLAFLAATATQNVHHFLLSLVIEVASHHSKNNRVARFKMRQLLKMYKGTTHSSSKSKLVWSTHWVSHCFPRLFSRSKCYWQHEPEHSSPVWLVSQCFQKANAQINRQANSVHSMISLKLANQR